MQEIPSEVIDSVAVMNNQISIYDTVGSRLYNTALQNVDSIRFLAPVPRADMLDVKFNADGTAQDVSPMANTIQAVGKPQTYYSTQYGCYFVRFADNAWGGTASRYYKISYANNINFQNALADGHTLETVIRCKYSGTIANTEAKYFTSQQGGGTGLMITKQSGTIKNELGFLPKVGGSWRWVNSGIVPVPGVDYHIVGVWNKETGKSQIYVNGELKNTVNTPGDYTFPATGCYYFSIGGDPSNATTVNQSWNGDVILARIYDQPLSAEQVSSLWHRLQDLEGPKDVQLAKNVVIYSGLRVVPGHRYYIYGDGFEASDKIVFTDGSDKTNTFTVPVTLYGTEGISLYLPDNLKSSTYNMHLVRGQQEQDLGMNELIAVDTLPRGARVIAHRGYWKSAGAAQNSRTALKAALALDDCYGIETDVHLTDDGYLIINHDASYNGVTIETSTYDQVKNLTLSNGEKIPTLNDFLDIMAADKSDKKLIIEIKTHTTSARTCTCVDSVMAAVRRMNLQDRVEYLAFSYDACKEVVKQDPTAKVAYLNGDVPPKGLYLDGIKGMAYTQANTTDIRLTQAHQLGITSNVWTVDTAVDMIYTNNRDIDYLTTNYPVEALRVYRHYKDNR